MEIRVGDWVKFVDAQTGTDVGRPTFVGETFPSGLVVCYGLWPWRRTATPNAAFTLAEVAERGHRVELVRHANQKEWEMARLNGVPLPESGRA